MRIRCADHVTPLYPQKLALTSPTGGGRSVGIVRSRTKATEFLVSFSYVYYSELFRGHEYQDHHYWFIILFYDISSAAWVRWCTYTRLLVSDKFEEFREYTLLYLVRVSGRTASMDSTEIPALWSSLTFRRLTSTIVDVPHR